MPTRRADGPASVVTVLYLLSCDGSHVVRDRGPAVIARLSDEASTLDVCPCPRALRVVPTGPPPSGAHARRAADGKHRRPPGFGRSCTEELSRSGHLHCSPAEWRGMQARLRVAGLPAATRRRSREIDALMRQAGPGGRESGTERRERRRSVALRSRWAIVGPPAAPTSPRSG